MLLLLWTNFSISLSVTELLLISSWATLYSLMFCIRHFIIYWRSCSGVKFLQYSPHTLNSPSPLSDWGSLPDALKDTLYSSSSEFWPCMPEELLTSPPYILFWCAGFLGTLAPLAALRSGQAVYWLKILHWHSQICWFWTTRSAPTAIP